MPEYVAKTLFGFENILAQELNDLGATNIKPLNRAVYFTGDKKLLYSANYNLRTALKILVPLRESEINNERDLYDFIRTINWDRFINASDTLAVEVSLNTTLFRHSQYIAQKIKDAVVDQFRDKYGSRPSVDLTDPKLIINAYISNKKVIISRDSSGESLHRRGYRVNQGPAPLNEVLAAGMVKLSGWSFKDPLIDFMCGSGTIPIEACMIALNIPPGDLRKNYGFQKWKDFDPVLFNEIANDRSKIKTRLETKIIASDLSAEYIKLSQRHARNAGVLKYIEFREGDFTNFNPPSTPGTVIINPPYGERIVQNNLNSLYKSIGDKLKNDFIGYQAWILSSNAEAMKNIGLRPSPKIVLYNGQLECRFNRFSLYSGSKKEKKTDIYH